MQLSLAVNGLEYIYCTDCRAPIFEKRKYVLVDGDIYHIECFTEKVERFLEMIKENTSEKQNT